jgi:V-type H+-transporting ATPase subunit D
MAQANFAAGDFAVTVRDSVKTKTSVRVTIQTTNVAGVWLPEFLLKGTDEEQDTKIGMTGGGQAIGKARERYIKYLKMLVAVASLQTQFVTIERVIKVTNRRVNALEFVVIPKIEDTIKWIIDELDELDREDFYRLKCVQDKKLEAKEKQVQELKAKMAAQAKARGIEEGAEEEKEDDEDVDILAVD